MYKLFDSRPVFLYLFVVLLFTLVRCIMLIWDPIGLPDDHDELSYLLQAETFSLGRISNPTPPFHEHFESFHIIQAPSYASKYPPGQAFFLFLGIKLFGHPWYGVLISCMLMVLSITWMIRGYTGTKWTLAAGIFIALRYSIWHYWASSYWGGAVAAMGGAMIFGALPRLKDSGSGWPLVINSVVFGLGLSVLSQTRPFEGFVVSILPLFYIAFLAWGYLRTRQMPKLIRMVGPAAVVIIFNLFLMAYYNYQITGDYLKMPYQLHSEQYTVQAPLLILENKSEVPEYNHDIFYRHHTGWEMITVNSVKDFLILKRQHFRRFIRYFYYWPIMLAIAFFFIYDDSIKIPYWSFVLFCLVLLLHPWFAPHYFAPAISIYYLLLVLGVKYLFNLDNKYLRSTARILISVLLLLTLVNSKSFANRFPGYINGTRHYVFQKQRIIDDLSQSGEKHLILVKYNKDHPLEEEWVYNHPDIQNSQVIWARSMSEEEDRKLIEYFKDRKAWLIEPDINGDKLSELN